MTWSSSPEVGTLDGAREAMGKSEIDAWLWEKFTTKHLVDNGEPWQRLAVGKGCGWWHIYIYYYIYICLNFQLMILNMFFFELIWSGLGGFEAETYYLDLFRSVSFVAILQWRLQQIVRVWGVHFQPKFQAVLAKLPWYSDERLDTIEFGRHWRHLGSSMRLIRPWRKALSWLSLLPMKLMWIAMEAHQTCSWECFHI